MAEGYVAMVADSDQQCRTQDALSETEVLAKLNECSSRLWHSQSFHEGLHEILDTVIELLRADKGNVQILNANGVLAIEAQRGFDGDFLEFFRAVSSKDDSACGRGWRSGQRINVEDIETDELYAPLRPIARICGYGAVISTPLFASDGSPQGMLSIHFNTVHRATDQDLHRLDLCARQASDFIQRCRSEEALRQSEEKLRQSDRLRNEFLAVLGHELRNPLGALSNSVAVLERALNDSPGGLCAIEIARRQIIHLARLLDDLLDVGHVITGKIGLAKRPIDLGAAVARTMEVFQQRPDQPQHRLKISIDTAWIDADPVRIEQVVINLMDNALKFTPQGGEVSVSVSTNNRRATLKVVDSGIGISKEFISKVFQPFAQAEPEFSGQPGSLGLGLALTKRLVELHDGEIRVESDGPGRGTTFTALFPPPGEQLPDTFHESTVHSSR